MSWARWPLLEALLLPVAAAATLPGHPAAPAAIPTLRADLAHAYRPVGPAGPVALSQPWAIPAAAGGDASIMISLHNYGDVPDNLLRAACATAESAEFVGPASAGTAPAHLDQVALAPGQSVIFTPDGVHLVLHHLSAPAQLGQTMHCTATFARSGERLFEASVRQDAPPPPPPI